jgi:hypothetical protein
MLYQPNSFDILAWTMLFFTVVKFIQSADNKWLWFAGITFAIGFLNKYNIAFLIIGLLPAILLTEHRSIFRNKQLYCALTLAFVLILPNLIWQFVNGFPVFKHFDELARTQLVNVNRFDFLKEQLLFFMGSLFVIVAALVAFFTYPPFRKFRLIGFTFLFVLSLFTYLKAKGYYAIGLYPILLAFGSVYLEKLLDGTRIKYLRPLAVLVPLILFLPMLQIAFPNRTPQQIRQHEKQYRDFGLLRWEDGKEHELPQDFADMLGWKELAHKVDSAATLIPDREHLLILCDNYGQAGAINFYSANKKTAAVSMNADYINWFRLDREIRHVILVQEADDDDPERKKEQPYFQTIKCIGEVANPYAREKGTRIFVLKNANIDVNKVLEKEIAARKRQN